jgi:hypothetical protein
MIQQNSLFKICIAFIVAIMAGCTQNSSTPVDPVQTSHLMYQPKGTITGLIRNRITSVPVGAAVISVGFDGTVQSTTSDGAGAFSFAYVPVGQYQIVNGTFVFSGTYTLTVSLTDYNASQSNPNKKYRDYYYTSVTIKFTSLAPGDSLAVSDMVGSALLEISYLNTTVMGQVVDQNMQPVVSALVMLYDATVVPNVVIGQTTTGPTGDYQFSNVDNGLTITAKSRSSDGSLEGTLPNFTLPANVTTDSLRSQVTAERIMITPVDDVDPYVISITPENNADVSPNSLQVVYKFSEPIKQKAYTRTDLPPGHSTIIDDITFAYVGLKKSTTAITFSAQWNATFTELTLTPQGIIGSAKYSVNAQVAFNSGKITDNANRKVVDNSRITGDFDLLVFTTNGASTVPAVPTVTRRYFSPLFYSLDFGGGAVGLEWNYDVNARSYNIYQSINGGTFELLQANFLGIQFTDTTGSLVIPSSAADPLSAGSVRYVVRAVSKDLVESPSSNIVTVTDDIRPKLTNASVAAAGGTNAWTYILRFSEPLTISTAENAANYSFANTGAVTFSVNGANYLGNSLGAYIVQLNVTSSAALPVGYLLLVGSVKDLAGNTMDPTANSKTF